MNNELLQSRLNDKGPIPHSLNPKNLRGAVLSRLAVADCDPYP
jgi:hypothetical protein